MNNLKQKAQKLRKNTTPQERKLWTILRNRQFYGHYFRRQFIIEPYIVDFVCREQKIIIELDGSQHLQPSDIEYDKKRTIYLNSLGYTVIRFKNNEIDNNIEGVYDYLKTVFRI
ncbi:endonuclease domain-containing protein [bacterium]|nr:endonuclease domain-containing protein [bacterium]